MEEGEEGERRRGGEERGERERGGEGRGMTFVARCYEAH